MSASKLSIYSGSTIAIGDYYSTTANGQAYVVKAANLAAAKSKGITPIAVIFSTTTSTIDQGHGWTHGYAMALQRVKIGTDNICIWGPNVDIDGLRNWDNMNPLETWINNKDGYTETWVIGNNPNYPAFYYAINYKNTINTPLTSSSWFLPSNGQGYECLCNLGRIEATPLAYNGGNDGSCGVLWRGSDVSTYTNNVNSHFINVQDYAPSDILLNPSLKIANYGDYFWCSSERHATIPYSMAVNSVDLWIDGNRPDIKSRQYSVRSVIAF